MSRTKIETTDEVVALREMLSDVPQRTAFGNDNHDATYAQIRVIERNMTKTTLLSEYEDGDPYVLSAALDAYEWLQGTGEAPSEGWALIAERTLAVA